MSEEHVNIPIEAEAEPTESYEDCIESAKDLPTDLSPDDFQKMFEEKVAECAERHKGGADDE